MSSSTLRPALLVGLLIWHWLLLALTSAVGIAQSMSQNEATAERPMHFGFQP